LRGEIRSWRKCWIERFSIARCGNLEEVFLPERHSIVVSGTHGKTTTTAMLAWIFHIAAKRPNFLVGGVAENFGKSLRTWRRRGVHLEGDEYETRFWDRGPKFFHLPSDDLIITSLEYDHADIYPDFETTNWRSAVGESCSPARPRGYFGAIRKNRGRACDARQKRLLSGGNVRFQ